MQKKTRAVVIGLSAILLAGGSGFAYYKLQGRAVPMRVLPAEPVAPSSAPASPLPAPPAPAAPPVSAAPSAPISVPPPSLQADHIQPVAPPQQGGAEKMAPVSAPAEAGGRGGTEMRTGPGSGPGRTPPIPPEGQGPKGQAPAKDGDPLEVSQFEKLPMQLKMQTFFQEAKLTGEQSQLLVEYNQARNQYMTKFSELAPAIMAPIMEVSPSSSSPSPSFFSAPPPRPSGPLPTVGGAPMAPPVAMARPTLDDRIRMMTEMTEALKGVKGAHDRFVESLAPSQKKRIVPILDANLI